MGGGAKAIFGGGDKKAERAARDAQEAQRRAAENQRQVAAVSNDRQLQQVNEQETRASVSRRAPRGRRLFSTSENGAASTLA